MMFRDSVSCPRSRNIAVPGCSNACADDELGCSSLREQQRLIGICQNRAHCTRWRSGGSGILVENAFQTKPSVSAILRRREIRIFKAAHGYGNRVLERLGTHEDH